MKVHQQKILAIIFSVLTLSICSCKETELIIPENGYSWPAPNRDYWPTKGWKIMELESLNINSSKMQIADEFAKNDHLSRALLVVKNGYLVFEKYYGEGGPDNSTNLWSVTKSVSSAIIGLLYDQHEFSSMHTKMTSLMPDYPEFGEITLHHVLTQTTGLNWVEEGPLWVQWAFSNDWVSEALSRGYQSKPGEKFFYSSANSHFLTALVDYKSDISVGALAKQKLFDPMGIEFYEVDSNLQYNNWLEYTYPAYQTWRKDPNGIECASFGLYLKARDMAKFGYLYLNKGFWDGKQLISKDWVEISTKEHIRNIYGRYSYGYQWYITKVGSYPAFLASGFGGQIIGVVPSLDLVVVLKFEAENPVDPKTGSSHDDMHLFELVVNAVKE